MNEVWRTYSRGPGFSFGLNLSTVAVPDPSITLYGHEYTVVLTPQNPEHVFEFEVSNPGEIRLWATWPRPATVSCLVFWLEEYDATGRRLELESSIHSSPFTSQSVLSPLKSPPASLPGVCCMPGLTNKRYMSPCSWGKGYAYRGPM